MSASSIETLTAAAARANDLALGASFLIIEEDRSEAEQRQGRFMLGLFSAVRDVLALARDNYWAPGVAPEDWETFESSQNELRLAEAILSDGEKR